MSLTVEALNILLFLLPGFLSGQIFYSFFQLKEVSVSKRTLDALLFSFVIYLLVSLTVEWEPLAHVALSESGLSYVFTNNGELIWFVLVWVFFIPIFIGMVYFSDLLHSLLRRAKITTKTSQPNTWSDAFSSQDRYVIITLKDKRRVRGYPMMFSTDSEEGYLYLFNPAWVNDCTSSEHLGPLEPFSKRHFSARTFSSLAC